MPVDPMDDISVHLTGVSLCYRLAKQRIPSLKEYAIHFLRGSLSYEKLWAVRDVDLTVRRGETLGIVGRNGAGKSTLLKVISRVLKPTQGTAVVNGLLAPILELGSGFDYELTGLENIYLNSLLLGHKKREIEEKVEDIIDFSGLGDFIRSPLRNYSSGMQARLGFAVATAWVPDILILDEVLAVGDITFTNKCEERLQRFHDAGATVLLVSHSPKAILTNCTRCLWLDDGRVRADGASEEVIDLYLREHGTDPGEHAGGRRPAAGA
jgi:ABC-2 type transport system ATP-binding protein